MSHPHPPTGPGPEQWRFDAFDTLFFKESRPMDSVGGAQLQSLFPPPARTLIGAIRTEIGACLHVAWSDYASDAQHSAKAIIGSADQLGPLSFVGPYLLRQNQRIYPAPLALMQTEASASGAARGKKFAQSGEAKQLLRLQPSDTISQCDLGALRLPCLVKARHDSDASQAGHAKAFDNSYISETGLRAFLAGGLPPADTLYPSGALYDAEDRLGIARDNNTRVAAEGALYQTRHIRPKADVAIGIIVNGLAGAQLPTQGTLRLGAEGRLAAWRREAAPGLPGLPTAAIKGAQVLLMLLTPARFLRGWLPDGFRQATLENGQTVWDGSLHGVSLRLLSAVLGKTQREGGWDLQHRQPRPVESLVPAGSCYFFQVLDGDAAALHGRKIGQDCAYGRGEVALGVW